MASVHSSSVSASILTLSSVPVSAPAAIHTGDESGSLQRDDVSVHHGEGERSRILRRGLRQRVGLRDQQGRHELWQTLSGEYITFGSFQFVI